MAGSGQPTVDGVDEPVIAAAVAQLVGAGIGRFEMPYIAARAGVDVAAIEDVWRDPAELLTAAWASRLDWTVGAGEGSLPGDLTRLGHVIRGSVCSAEDRAVFRSSLPIDGEHRFAEVRKRFWDAQFDAAAGILLRSDRRGELRPGVDHLEAARMFCTAMCFDALYLDAAIPPDYQHSVIDVFLFGVAAQPTPDPAEIDRQVAERVGASRRDVLGQEKPRIQYSLVSAAQIRQAVLDAAIKEVTLRGPELVTRDAIARRAGVTVQVLERIWPTDSALLSEAADRARRESRPLADTGSLWGDVLAFAAAKDALTSTPEARANFLRILPCGASGRNAAVVVDHWLAGLRESTAICLRASERGDLRDGVDPDHATRALAASLYYDLFFANGRMRTDYTAAVLDVFLHGVSRSVEGQLDQ